MLKYSASRQALSDERLSDLGRRTAKERIARLALVLHDLLAVRGMVNGDSFPFHLRQEHIADALGLTKVHVSRTLQGLRHEGLLEIDRQTATSLDFRGLRELTDYSETPAQETLLAPPSPGQPAQGRRLCHRNVTVDVGRSTPVLSAATIPRTWNAQLPPRDGRRRRAGE